MNGQRVGYVRVSSVEQNTDRQLEGIDLDRTFIDKTSGKNTKRPQLESMLGYVREGDHIIVHSMDRLARNLLDLLKMVEDITSRGISIEFRKEQLTFTGEDTPIPRLLLSVMGAIAEFERSLIRERQREGIEIAKQKGIYKGRKKSLNETQIAELKKRVNSGEKKSELARGYGISRETLYQYLKTS